MITWDIDTMFAVAGLLQGTVALAAVGLLRRNLKHWRDRCLHVEADLKALRREMEMVASMSVRTGRQVKRIEHDYSDVADRVDLVELRGPARSLDEAIDSARRGEDPSRLTRQFGLSRGEAELVTRLHGRKKSA
jgi:hypothetical protein